LGDGQPLLTPPTRLTRRIEFIGDSYTCGYGVESPSTTCTIPQLREYENNYLAYDNVASTDISAEFHVIAYSGRGMVRNYGDPNQISLYPMPKYYMQTLVNDETQNWNFSSWIPDVVVIFLGENDFSTQPQPTQEQYEGTFEVKQPGLPNVTTAGFGYLNLIALVNSYYPNAQIFCLSAGYASAAPMDTYVRDVVAQALLDGASYVNLVELSPSIAFTGCSDHPGVPGQSIWGQKLAEVIMTTMNWTTGNSSHGLVLSITVLLSIMLQIYIP